MTKHKIKHLNLLAIDIFLKIKDYEVGSLYIYSHLIQVNMIVIRIFFICQYHKIPWLTLIPKAVRTFKR